MPMRGPKSDTGGVDSLWPKMSPPLTPILYLALTCAVVTGSAEQSQAGGQEHYLFLRFLVVMDLGYLGL